MRATKLSSLSVSPVYFHPYSAAYVTSLFSSSFFLLTSIMDHALINGCAFCDRTFPHFFPLYLVMLRFL